MAATELRDSEIARTFLMQGLWLQRLNPTTVETIGAPLSCALTLAAADDAVPPVGFIADVIHLIRGDIVTQHDDVHGPHGLPPQSIRAYEDYVLGKLYADAAFERASTAISRYDEADRIKAIAWLLARLCEHIQFGGVLISPAVARSLQGLPPDELLVQSGDLLQTDGLLPLLPEGYEQLITGFRTVGEVLSAEDVFELERGTALIEFGQRLALRQTLRAADEFARKLPQKTPRPSSRQRIIPTHIPEEDTYPVGGFTSISTRGSVESLLHSQLAYMEKDDARRPDLFEIKFLRSELLYYSRDDNDFLRRRRTFQFVLFPDLTTCRIKDPEQLYQRLILLLGMQVVLVQKLVEWLSDDALLFEILFVNPSGPPPLDDEQELLQMILADQIQSGTVTIDSVLPDKVTERAEEHARTSMTHSLLFTTKKQSLTFDQAMPININVAKPRPRLLLPDDVALTEYASFDDALNCLAGELV